MSRPGQKPLEGLIAAIAGLIAVHPDPTVNATGELMNGCLSSLLGDILGEEQSGLLFEDAIAAVSPVLESQFGLKVVTTAMLNKSAAAETDDLLTRLRKGGL